MRKGRALGIAAIVLVVAGCDAIAGALPEPPAVPQPCGQLFNPVRCLAMTDYAAYQLRTTREDVVSLEVMPDPTPRIVDGVTILETRGGAAPIELRVTLADGTIRQASMCGGIPSGPACMDAPRLEAGSITQGGYRDYPEGAEPVPSPAPDAVAAATDLRVDRLDIPIDHVGKHEVVLGEAKLPNGILTTADLGLVEPWPANVTIIEGGVWLEIRSLEDGEPLRNYYDHGWREGTESVEAVLVFDVFRFDEGAALSIRDVVVR